MGLRSVILVQRGVMREWKVGWGTLQVRCSNTGSSRGAGIGRLGHPRNMLRKGYEEPDARAEGFDEKPAGV